jgi:hypothetical protein
MDLAKEFERHAADYDLMAMRTKDPDTKVQWRKLAGHFRLCAEKNALGRDYHKTIN